MIPDRHHARRRTLQRQAGFTLIELLVVISIIALLSSIILAALATARGKSKDAAIKELAHQMQTVYALEYSKNNSYAGLKINTNNSVLGQYSCTGSISCSITSSAGCSSFYNNGTNSGTTEAEKICLDIFNKNSTIFVGSSDAFISTFGVYVPYPSNVNTSGRCLGSLGTASDQTSSPACFATGISW